METEAIKIIYDYPAIDYEKALNCAMDDLLSHGYSIDNLGIAKNNNAKAIMCHKE